MKPRTHVAAFALALAASAIPSLVNAQAPTVPPLASRFVVEQPAGQWLAHVFFGAPVQSTSGEVIGDINDLLFTPAGQISTVVLGVGGVLGLGEKNVAVSFTSLSFKVGPEGARVIVVALTKADLQAAPAFKAIEKTTYDAMRDKAAELGKKTAEKAGQLKDQVVKKVDEMKTDAAKKP